MKYQVVFTYLKDYPVQKISAGDRYVVSTYKTRKAAEKEAASWNRTHSDELTATVAAVSSD